MEQNAGTIITYLQEGNRQFLSYCKKKVLLVYPALTYAFYKAHIKKTTYKTSTSCDNSV